MIRIGEFARIGGITIKALRHYDAIGLLSPQWVDPVTGYRHYAVTQLPRLYRLLAYRDLGLPLARVRTLLDREVDTALLRCALLDKRDELRTRVETGRAQLAQVEHLLGLADVGSGAPPHHVVIRDVQARSVASIRRRMSDYSELDPLLDRLTSLIGRAEPIAGLGAVWHRCLRDADGNGDAPLIDCEALAFLADRPARLPDCRVYELPAARVAALVHSGADELTPAAYATIADSVDAHGYEIAWPMREVYLRGDGGAVDTMVEAIFPLRPRRRAEPRAGAARRASSRRAA